MIRSEAFISNGERPATRRIRMVEGTLEFNVPDTEAYEETGKQNGGDIVYLIIIIMNIYAHTSS